MSVNVINIGSTNPEISLVYSKHTKLTVHRLYICMHVFYFLYIFFIKYIDIFSVTLYEIFDTINRENKNGIIMGDFNIDLLKFGSHSKTSEYLDNIFSHGFIPIISKPTRVTNTSATLIDHIYTNNPSTSTNSGIIITDVADHFGTFYSESDTKRTSITNKM